MKTIREWLETLPEPYKTQALTNAKDAGTIEENGYCALSAALTSAFDWTECPMARGYDYWETIAKSEGEVLPYAGQTEPPNNALSALHAIAVKKEIPIEEISAVRPVNDKGEWEYQLINSGEHFFINLSNDQ